MRTFKLEISTPEGLAYSGEATQLSVRAIDGSLSVLAGHIPMVTALKNDVCRVYDAQGNLREADCSGGILSVGRNSVRLLCSFFKFK